MILKIELDEWGFPEGQILSIEINDDRTYDPGAVLQFEGYPLKSCSAIVATVKYLDALEKQGFDLNDTLDDEMKNR